MSDIHTIDDIINTLIEVRNKLSANEIELKARKDRIEELELELGKYKAMCYDKHEKDSTLDMNPSDEEHYKPGDTIIFKREHSLDRLSTTCGGPITLDQYKDAVSYMMKSGMFFLEIPAPEVRKQIDPFVRVENIIGRVTSFDEHTITVKMASKYSMPEPGRKLLEDLTKKEIDETIRICHRMIVKPNNHGVMIDRIISCYLVEKKSESSKSKPIYTDKPDTHGRTDLIAIEEE